MRRDRRRSTENPQTTSNIGFDPIAQANGMPIAAKPDEVLRQKFARRLGILRPHEMSKPEQELDVELGNRELPIYALKSVITEAISNNQVTIIMGETGSGKSTQVMQYLIEKGYIVTMTQPRRLAASMLAERVEEEVESKIGYDAKHMIGCHTAELNTLTSYTRGAVLTDGLRLVEELNNRGEIEHEVLIIDEVHEWNTNIETIIAWTKALLKDRPNMRVVVMSASMDAVSLANYYSDVTSRPPIIEVPGRTHNIEYQYEPNSTAVIEAIKYAMQDKTVMVFMPGVGEINDAIGQTYKVLHSMGREDILVLGLHADMTSAQQAKVKERIPGPKIIFATNVAETSITIPAVDVIVDCGLERTMVRNKSTGANSLELNTISKANIRQRAGRCGRTKDGLYILTRLSEDYSFIPIEDRPDYATPEILRTNLHRTYLYLSAAALRMEDLDFFHEVDSDSIAKSKTALSVIGALDSEGNITQRGRRMNQFPLSPSLSRMLVYLEESGASAALRGHAAAMVSCIEAGDIADYKGGDTWRSQINETDSDLLAQLQLFIQAKSIERDYDLRVRGINVRRFRQAQKTYNRILYRMKIPESAAHDYVSLEEKQELIEAIAAGMIDFVYILKGGVYVDALSKYREERLLGDRSVVSGSPNMIVATPFRIPPRPGYPDELHIVQHVTKIGPQVLGAVAGRLLSWESTGKVRWREEKPIGEQQRVFRDRLRLPEFRETEVAWTSQLRDEIIERYITHPGGAYKDLLNLKRTLEELAHRDPSVPILTQDTIDRLVQKAASARIYSPGELDGRLRQIALVNEGIYLDQMISPESRAAIEARSPNYVNFNGITLSLRYRSGRPSIQHPDQYKEWLLTQAGPLRLSDGRDIYIHHNKKMYTLEQFRNAFSR